MKDVAAAVVATIVTVAVATEIAVAAAVAEIAVAAAAEIVVAVAVVEVADVVEIVVAAVAVATGTRSHNKTLQNGHFFTSDRFLFAEHFVSFFEGIFD